MTTVMFWSPDNGQGKTSAHTVITAITAALQYRARLLLCHNDERGHGVEYGITADLSEPVADIWKNGPGIDRLHYLQQSGILNAGNVTDYMVPLVRDRLHLLAGTQHAHNEANRNPVFWNNLFQAASHHYDLVLMDAGCGEDKLPLLELADLVVVNLGQNRESLHNFFANPLYADWEWSSSWMPVIGAYQPKGKLTETEISRRFGLQRQLYTLNHCQPLQDAWNVQRLLSFMRNRLVLDWPEQQLGQFFRQSFLLTSGILEQLEQQENAALPQQAVLAGERSSIHRIRHLALKMPSLVYSPV
ncbi:hypothetical protein ACE3MZ_13265 [Paenibacillus sp. WLX1005]|uniref:hypothetical protein n=1 Tax=unclassified Paenibacillus TaxID=185978 RepID=UPI0039842863